MSAFLVQAEPVLNLNLISPTVVCSTGNDSVSYSVSGSGIPANTNIVIYQSTDSLFNPYLGQGDSIGYIPGNAIPQDTVNFGDCIKTLGIFIDACGASGQEGKNEYIILTSGNGIKVSNLAIDFSTQNNGGATNADINTGTSPCLYQTPTPSLIANLRVGSCNASNVIPASPTDSIPANAIILLFTSDNVTANYGIAGLCNLGYPIYVLQSACERTIGAFTNQSRCDAPSRYRTTVAIDKRQNCRDNFTYDLCDIFDEDGTYAIRQQGTDTASVANNGIRINAIDSCGGIDYTQLDFSADTILKFRISPNFCNDGFHYIKAITNPAGTQPVSNTIAYKLVCNDVSAISTTTTICSGESAIVNISSTDPNATLSWTVSGGTNITGASAGTGNTINQVLTYNGNTKDSVTYTAISSDAGCTKTQTVKVVVNNCITICNPTILGNTPFCEGDSITLDAGSGFSSYSWNTGASSQTIKVKTGGKYVVSVTGQNDCTGSDSVQVVVNAIPQVSISGNTAFCVQSATRLTANADVDSLRWNTGETTNSISVDQAQAYSVTVYDNGCSNTASVQVTQLNLPASFSLGNDTTFCGNFSKVLSTGNQQTQWSTSVTAAQITVTEAGTYIATISNDCGSVSDTIVISKNELPFVNLGNDTAFCKGQLVLTAPTELRSYVWSTGEQSQSISVSEAGTYSVTVTDVNGCSGTDEIVISSNCSNELWIANAFTPNSDGVNDVFYIRGNPQNTTIERFIIYNRWGNKVFEATNILPDDATLGWNGTFKGEPAQFEVYGYEVVARFSDGQKKTLKGNVTLLK
jgi:gliding motility-associated-like protein